MKHVTEHYYHVYNKGIAGQPVFKNDENYLFLLDKTKLYLIDYKLSLIAYCLMPTHYHFLIRTNVVKDLSGFIQRLFNSYAQAFNRQQNRTGKLFEKKPKNKLVETDQYALQLSRYIHLNPVRAELVKHPQDWPYSNYLEWVNSRDGTLFDPVFVKQYFPTTESYKSFVLDEISSKKDASSLPKV